MRLVSKNSKTNPLNWMKNKQTTDKTKIINNRDGIGYNFFHGVKKMMAKLQNNFGLRLFKTHFHILFFTLKKDLFLRN